MNGPCRDLMAELLSAGAATARDYGPGESGRNAGNHPKRIVTLLGELPPIRRTYWYDEDGHEGHYPFDGSKWLQTVWRSHFPFATPILDVYHALEHLKPMMLGLGLREGSKEWKYRHHYWSERIKAGKARNVLDYIRKNMKARLGKDAMREYRYYRGNAGRMKYDEYRANGWFIGSGVIESGCKTVIGQRFKQSGMFWSLKGAKALLPLRTLHKSNRLEEFFAYLVRDLRQVDCAA